MSIKIFHTADIHIGLKFISRDYPESVREQLIGERFNVLKRMVTSANEANCNLFVIAGDLFDSINTPLKHVKSAGEILSKFEGEYIVVLPGNHDFIDNSDGKIWKVFSETLAKSSLLLLKECRKYDIECGDKKINFYSGPCDSKHSSENRIKWILDQQINTTEINIGAAHGAVEGVSPDNDDKYFLMKENELRAAKMDIWLLGHTHIQLPNERLNHPLFFMPSTPEPDGFDCGHGGGAWYIEIEKGEPLIYRSIQTGTYNFRNLRYNVNCREDLDRLREELGKLKTETTLIKIKLEGRFSSEEMNSIPEFEDWLKNKFLYTEISTEIALNIDKRFIDSRYPDNSLPHLLLSELMNDNEDAFVVNLAYDLIEEAGK